MTAALVIGPILGTSGLILGFSGLILSLSKEPAAAEESGICAKVRIRLTQDVAITRTAFRATLEVVNAPENVTLENVNVTLDIRNDAEAVSNNLFGITAPELTGISDVSGSGSIPPGTTVQAVWTIIPTRDAAPDVPTRYFVGGTLSYVQDGQLINQPLWPAPIMVKPDPLLYLDYFWVRDVYSDDARTPEIEPSEPFPLGLIIKNQGKGIAYNVRITSSQPEIVENEKGLLISFQIISTQVNNGEVTPSLSVNLGNIEPAGTSVASVIACVLFIPAGLRLTLMAPAAVVPMLAVDFSCAVLGSFLLLAVRVSVGWSIQTAWIVLFALGGAAAFIGLWLIVPGGKKRLLDYYNAARRVFVPRVESTPAH